LGRAPRFLTIQLIREVHKALVSTGAFSICGAGALAVAFINEKGRIAPMRPYRVRPG
jgi:hypothetical protein